MSYQSAKNNQTAANRLRDAHAESQSRDPEARGIELCTVARGDDEELRVTWETFKGNPYILLRVWTRAQGHWYPGRKGCTIRLRELPAMADAILKAMHLADAHALQKATRQDA